MDEPPSTLHDDITDVPGVQVGHASDFKAKTGVTVILPPPEGARAGVHMGGPATSTRQMDSLRPHHLVDRIFGICFSGGSGYGLDAGGGVMAYLESQGIGLPIVENVIPITPTAVIFDLNFGDGSVRPDKKMGWDACADAGPGPIEQGSVGAGTGATVGKLFGLPHAMKGGVGSASVSSLDLVVGALVVANPFGDVTDTEGNILAGVRETPDSLEFADAAALLGNGSAISRPVSVENTTLAVIAVNAKLDKIGASRIAAQATLGLGNVIRPFHTHIDGDLTIVFGVGENPADPVRIGLMASLALQNAVIKAVTKADGFGSLPANADLEKISILI